MLHSFCNKARHVFATDAAGETLDDIQVEAFAVVREAARRTLGMRHFDVQVLPNPVVYVIAGLYVFLLMFSCKKNILLSDFCFQLGFFVVG